MLFKCARMRMIWQVEYPDDRAHPTCIVQHSLGFKYPRTYYEANDKKVHDLVTATDVECFKPCWWHVSMDGTLGPTL